MPTHSSHILSMSSDTEPRLLKQSACPICAKPSVERFRPFCSRRCADVDLHRWLSGAYAVPAVEAEGDADDEAAESEQPPRHR